MVQHQAQEKVIEDKAQGSLSLSVSPGHHKGSHDLEILTHTANNRKTSVPPRLPICIFSGEHKASWDEETQGGLEECVSLFLCHSLDRAEKPKTALHAEFGPMGLQRDKRSESHPTLPHYDSGPGSKRSNKHTHGHKPKHTQK